MASPSPHMPTLAVAAEYLDRVWDRWVSADDGDREWAAVEEAVGSLRRALAGTRRMKLSKDQYGFWRSRCACRWPGSPWDGSAGRTRAIDEFAAHVCGEG